MKTFFTNYKEIILLILGFLLTTIGGSFIGYFIQERSWSHQHQLELYENEQAEAKDFFNNISSLLDKRIYTARNLYFEGRRKKSQNKSDYEYLPKYIETVDEWSSNYNKNLALIERYFGKDVKDSFIIGITINFRTINENINAYLSAPNDSLRIVLDRNFIELNTQIYQFDSTLLSSIKLNKLASQ